MFGQRLKQLRKKRKLTMQEVADYVGVAKSTYAGYESGYRQPTIESIQTISRKLRTSADYLLGLTDYAELPAEINHNAKEYLNIGKLHWDGVPLEKGDLELIRSLMERVLRDRSLPEED
ncbi:transcriptional regulator [Paenibacillus sp. MY03]|jgi:transcriptional regulator with XRE-family HTH domain|uniref:Transcriptional regulator n=1 Tax=Paenibacillus agaridevorans TaxID=171404 RepID=A0A2R5EZ31_9BACL|nr:MULTISPECIES: helix-turn-helix domain-containing protein [Paenibacillus]OUS75388.1 transcriptional regulator [Paenibacillus sp. MY03]QNK55266.1 helix-turn-helix domain-containing protein [Paenibacillus sp. PAMC21692]GBG11930.1 transcriptional regulator [Paenibacillus agaridevorans]